MSAVAEKPGPLRQTWAAIDNYWFRLGSPTALGVYRIATGFLAFANLFLLAFDWDTWFSERGYIPSWIGRTWLGPNPSLWYGGAFTIPRINLLSGVTDSRIAIAFYALLMISALTTMLGIWTRASTIFLALGMVSLQHRNPVILHGGDSVVRLAVLYLALSPCGQACSLDRLLGLWKGDESHAPVKAPIWSQRLICYNVALIYFTTVWLKYYGGLWRNGTATWFPARLAEFYRFPVPGFVNQLPMVRITTYGTLMVEFAMGTLVFFRPARKYVLLAAVLMHAFIEYSMNIPLFSFLMITSYITFFDGEEVSGWATRVGTRMRGLHVTVRLPKGMRLTPRAVALLDSLDPFKLVHYLPGESDRWEAETHGGRAIPAAWAIASRSLGAWIFAWIPGAMDRLLAKGLVAD